MCKNATGGQDSFGCNDYSLKTANTGLATVAAGNAKLTGDASLVPVLTAGTHNGTIIRSITVKAAMPVTTGMIRLFVGTTASTAVLYKEVPIPNMPMLTATPTPAPMLTLYEMKLEGGMTIPSGNRLFASTQNTETFNIIAEGLDWTYPATNSGPGCMLQLYAGNLYTGRRRDKHRQYRYGWLW